MRSFQLLPVLLVSSSLLSQAACGGGSASESDMPAPEGAQPLDLPSVPYNYANPEIPDHFWVESERFHGQIPLMQSDNTPTHNPISDAGATLGRVLFYDKSLSQNRTIACASCHKVERGFSDDRILSLGFAGGETKRHSMGLTNSRFYDGERFFWDQRAATLEAQVLMPFLDPVEMGMSLDSLKLRVTEASYYAELFRDAFGDAEISSDRISLALSQFVRSMISTSSKYDRGRAMVPRRSDPFPNFSDEENLGKALFVSPPPRGGFGCFVCHQGEGFVAREATSNGLDATAVDLGYGTVTSLQRDDGTFKVPSLRNVDMRAPFMHDGRFATIEEVVDHYSDKVQPNPNLGPPFFISDGQVNQIRMTEQEKAALAAFLRTLSDEEMTSDPKFNDPFTGK